VARIQVNLRLDEKIVQEVEKLVAEGHFKTDLLPALKGKGFL